MTTQLIEDTKYANKEQILIAFNDLKYRISDQELDNLTVDNFIKICEQRFKIKFKKNLVNNILCKINNNNNKKKKEKKLANYETTYNCLLNIIVKFSIFERNNSIDEYIKELNNNKDYVFDNKIVDKILKKIENNLIIEI